MDEMAAAVCYFDRNWVGNQPSQLLVVLPPGWVYVIVDDDFGDGQRILINN